MAISFNVTVINIAELIFRMKGHVWQIKIAGGAFKT